MAILPAGLLLADESRTLVSVEWLEQHKGDSNVVIVDARPEAEYAKGHISGAILINTYDNLVDSSPQGQRAFDEWLADTLGRPGINPQDTVVVYENKLGMRAGRAYWMLCYAGQETVYILGGGLEAWQRKQLPLSTHSPSSRPAGRYRLKPQKKYLATAQEVAAQAKDRKVLILDVRSRGEYEGKSGPTDCARQGHIPGAVWVEWTEFLSPDSSAFQAPEKLGVMLMEKGITPDKQVVVYCHRGARAATVWAALDDLGYPKVRNYLGSWHDWAGKKELPAE